MTDSSFANRSIEASRPLAPAQSPTAPYRPRAPPSAPAARPPAPAQRATPARGSRARPAAPRRRAPPPRRHRRARRAAPPAPIASRPTRRADAPLAVVSSPLERAVGALRREVLADVIGEPRAPARKEPGVALAKALVLRNNMPDVARITGKRLSLGRLRAHPRRLPEPGHIREHALDPPARAARSRHANPPTVRDAPSMRRRAPHVQTPPLPRIRALPGERSGARSTPNGNETHTRRSRADPPEETS